MRSGLKRDHPKSRDCLSPIPGVLVARLAGVGLIALHLPAVGLLVRRQGQVAQRLKSVLRDEDTLSRQGAAEFAQVLTYTDAKGLRRLPSSSRRNWPRPATSRSTAW